MIWGSNACDIKRQTVRGSGLFDSTIHPKYLGSQVAADGGYERDVVPNECGYRAWIALKSVLSNRGLGIMAKKCLYEGAIVLKVLYGAEACGMRSAERRKECS